jgi:HKD family nuclease
MRASRSNNSSLAVVMLASLLLVGIVALAAPPIASAVPIGDLHFVTSSGVPQFPYQTGTTVTVTGIVVSPDSCFSKSNNEVVVRDMTGAIVCFRSSGIGAGFHYNLGDSVTVTGQIFHFNGLTEINNATLNTKHSTGSQNLFPIVTTCKAVRDSTFDFDNIAEPRESQLIRINNVSLVSGTWPTTCVGSPNTYVTINDGTATINMLIDGDTGVCGSANPGGPFDVIGILEQVDTTAPYDCCYEIRPRFASDIIRHVQGPNITAGPSAVVNDSTSATISWTTDVASKSIVEYGPNVSYGSLKGDSTLVTSHVVTLTGLLPNKVYQYRVISCDAIGCRASANKTFATPSSAPTVMNFYFNKSVNGTLANPDLANGPADIQARLIDFINRATYSIDCAFYSFAASPVTNALIAKWNQGVKIRFIMDAENSQTQADMLRNVGIPVITSTFGGNHSNGGIMHNKFCVVDGRDGDTTNDWLWTGSTNTSTQQLFTDANNSLEIRDFSLAQCYQTEFEEMWGSNNDVPEGALAKMGSAKTNNTPHFFNVAGIPIEVWFAPSDGVESRYVQYVQTANYGIAFNLLLFTSDPIADAMKARYDGIPGFYVRGVIDNANINISGSEYPEMKGLSGPNPWFPPADVWSATEPGIHHHKVIIIDEGRTDSDPTLITGSFNLSNAANTVNDENSIVFHSQRIANLYMQEFSARYMASGGTANFTVGVEPGAAEAFSFAPPFPSPTRSGGMTTFSLVVPSNLAPGRRATIALYSIDGRAVRTLFDGPATAGPMSIQWDGRDAAGRDVPAGVYFARATVAGSAIDRKVVRIP